MDPSLIQAAPNPYESDSSSEDEGTLSQNPSSAVPHTISKVENTREPRIPWSDANVDLLMSLRHEGMPFEEISKRFEGRTPWACYQKHRRISDNPREHRPWTSSEEQLLFSLHKAKYSWKEISDNFPERTLRAALRKIGYMGIPDYYEAVFPWTQYEDEQLEDLHLAGNNWLTISLRMSGPTVGDCLLRYLEKHGSLPYPCPTASKFPWAPAEIETLVSMRNNGKDWDEIASQLSSHDGLDCRNYWYNNHWDTYRRCFPDGQHDMSHLANSSASGKTAT